MISSCILLLANYLLLIIILLFIIYLMNNALGGWSLDSLKATSLVHFNKVGVCTLGREISKTWRFSYEALSVTSPRAVLYPSLARCHKHNWPFDPLEQLATRENMCIVTFCNLYMLPRNIYIYLLHCCYFN
jgi:hypothetical protein